MELKARTARSIADEEEILELGADSPIESAQVYLKSEADKVIADQKFKRCLAMENWCMTEYLHSKCLDFTNTEQWYWRRWHIRWRNLAKKFKEGV